jgi:hypothetical protein
MRVVMAPMTGLRGRWRARTVSVFRPGKRLCDDIGTLLIGLDLLEFYRPECNLPTS